MKTTARCAGLLVSILSAAPLLAANSPFAEQYEKSLTEAGIAIDAAGLNEFLMEYHPGSEQQKVYRELVRQLGADDFFAREAAMQRLLRMPLASSAELAAAAADSDLEVRWRAKILLDQTARPRNDLLYSAFVVIQDHQLRGLADAILGTSPLCRSDHMRVAMVRALQATVQAEDAPLLREQLKSADADLRAVAATVLGGLLGDQARPDLTSTLSDPDDHVKLAAAEVLAPAGSPEALQVLAALLMSDGLSTRNRSIQLLRVHTKLELPYSGYEPEADRTRHAAAWQKAIESRRRENDASVVMPPRDEAPLLVHSRHLNRLFEVSPDQAQELKIPAGASSVRALPHGHQLLVISRDRRLIERNAEGETVWQVEQTAGLPLVAERLVNGDTWLATATHQLIQYTSDGSRGISLTLNAPVIDVRGLAGGGLVVLHPDSLRRLNDAGELVWESRPLESASSVCALSDGHCLVALNQTGRIVEIDDGGAQTPLPALFDHPVLVAQLSADKGSLVVIDSTGLQITDRQGAPIQTLQKFSQFDQVQEPNVIFKGL